MYVRIINYLLGYDRKKIASSVNRLRLVHVLAARPRT